MKEQTIYLVFLSGGTYEDYWEDLLITFDNLKEAEQYIDNYILPDTRKLRRDFQNFEDRIYEDSCWADLPEGFSIEDEFLKAHPEYTVEDLDNLESLYREADSLIIKKLVTGKNASIKQLKWKYLENA